MEDKIQQILGWEENKAPPYRILFHPTFRCNLKCRFCGNHKKKEDELKEDMNEKNWLNAVNDSANLGIKEVIITGGEPFFNSGLLMKIVKQIKKKRMRGYLITNATLISQKFAKELININWEELHISIDGSNKIIHDSLRGVKGSFEKSIKTIDTINTLKKRKGRNPNIIILFTITNKNYKDLSNMVKLAKKKGISRLQFGPLWANIPSSKKLKLNKKQSIGLIKEAKNAKNIAESLKLTTNLDMLIDYNVHERNNMKKNYLIDLRKKERGLTNVACYMPWLQLYIFPDGKVSHCCIDFNGKENVKNKSLHEIWYGKHFQKLRETFIDKKFLDICKNCPLSCFDENIGIKNKIRFEKQKIEGNNKNKRTKELKESEKDRIIKFLKEELERKDNELTSIIKSKGYKYILKNIWEIYNKFKWKKE